jgi:hypothetical protein
MTIWTVEYWPSVNCDLNDPAAGNECPRFRIVPQGDPGPWIAQTNPHLPREVQEEAALLIADALSRILGV